MNLQLVTDECAALGELRERNGDEIEDNTDANRGALKGNIGDEVRVVESETTEIHIEMPGYTGEQNEEFVDMRRTFMGNLQKLNVTTDSHLEKEGE